MLLKERGIKPERYSSSHFMVCHSASGGENALAFAFNKEYGIPTLGYEGRVVTQNDPIAIFTSHMADVGDFYRRAQKIRVMTVAEGTDVIKKISDMDNPSDEIARGFNYKPVWFR